MNRRAKSPCVFGWLILLLAGAAGAYAQTAPTAPNAARADDSNSAKAAPTPPFEVLRFEEDWSFLSERRGSFSNYEKLKYISLGKREDWYLSVGGEMRQRYEFTENPSWGAETTDKKGYYQQRYLLHADFHFGKRVRAFAQIGSQFETGRADGPRPTDEDRLDLNQLFADVKFDFGKKNSLTLRAGRQEMTFGGGFLVAVREPLNVRRGFDGARAILNTNKWRVDAFLTKPVATKRGVFNDAPDPAQTFWGVYAARPSKLLPGGSVDLYYFGLDRKNARFEQGARRETRHTVGTRIWGKSLGWDYNQEFIYQWGAFGGGSINAGGIVSETGYTFDKLRFRPRIALRAEITSGDRDPHDKNLQTFDALFTRSSVYWEPVLNGPANRTLLQPALNFQMSKTVKLTFAPSFFRRTSRGDGIYGAAGNFIRAGAASRARRIGNLTTFQAEWQINRHFSWVGVYSYYAAGRFLRASGTSQPVNYATSWISYKF